MSFQRGQPHLEHHNISNGLPPVANPSAECPSNRETFTVNADAKFHPAIYPNEESRGNIPGSGRVNDHYGGDVPVAQFSIGHGSVTDGHTLSSNYIHQRAGAESGAELFPDQTAAAIPHLQIPSLEERSVRYGNLPSPYGVDSHYAVPRGHIPGHAFWRNAPTPVHIGPSYEATTPPQQVNGMINAGLTRGEGSPGYLIGPDGQNAWVDSSQKLSGHDGSDIPEHPYAHALKLNPKALGQENQHPKPVDVIHPPQEINSGSSLEPVQLLKSPLNMVWNQEVLRNDTHITEAMSLLSRSSHGEGKEENTEDKVETSSAQMQSISFSEQNKISENVSGAATPVESNNSNSKLSAESGNVEKLADEATSTPEDSKHLVDQFSFLPELIASVKKAALDVAEEVKATDDEHANSQINNSPTKEETANEVEPVVRMK